MNIDIDGYDFTIFVYSFYSLFTQEICVCTVSEPFLHTDTSAPTYSGQL